MGWRSWNKADKTLLAAGVIFVFALCLHLQYRNRAFADGFLFCAEAALVGGIADWFAVTALFRKPLGFPWHTAILPRRRQAFIDASVGMVQQEFFSRRKLFQRIRGWDLLGFLLDWLRREETKMMLSAQLLHYVRSFLLHMDAEAYAVSGAKRLRNMLLAMPPQKILQMGSTWLQEKEHDRQFLMQLADILREKAAKPETRTAIEALLEAYQKDKVSGTMASFLAGLAHAMNLVNFEEAAALMQQQLLAMLTELGTKDSALQREILQLFYAKTQDMVQDEDFVRMFQQLREQILLELPLEAAVQRCLENIQHDFAANAGQGTAFMPVLRERLAHVIETELERGLELLRVHKGLQREIDRFLYDLVARTTLAAQGMVGVIVRSVLGRLTDEQLNHLVYDKVEPDLLWIRMNEIGRAHV